MVSEGHRKTAGLLAGMGGVGAPRYSSSELLEKPPSMYCNLRHKHLCHLTQQFRDLGSDPGSCVQCNPTPAGQFNSSFLWKEAMPFPQAASQTAELSCCGAGVVFMKFPICLLSLEKWFLFLLFLMFKKKFIFSSYFSF